MTSPISASRSTTYLGAFAALWGGTVVLLRSSQEFKISEALLSFVVLAVVLPGLALLATRRVTPLHVCVRRPGVETVALLFYLAGVAWVLVRGFGYFVHVEAEPWRSIATLGLKLLIFVFVPGAMIWVLGGYKGTDRVGFAVGGRALMPALWMSLAVLVMQLLLGSGMQQIRAAHLPPWTIAVASPLSFVWLMFEVGLVEEFFFRELVQERLSVVLRSPWAGLVVAAVLFGLAHAPGFYLRSASTQEGLGLHPSLMMAVGYSIAMTSLAGLFLGVLWIRTRNLAVLIVVHAATDFLPNLTEWVRAFHLVKT